MKKIFFVFTILIINFCHAQDTTKVLFIGNSHTFVNDLPNTFFQMATSAGKIVFVDSYTMGGATLQMHSQNTGTINKIFEREWDFVILQEQSQIPSLIPERDTMMYPYAIFLDSIIHNSSLCTQTMFFMTWAHKNGDLEILQNGGSDSFEEMQQRLRSGYMTIADSLNAAIAPCGWVWREVIKNHSSIELYSQDQYHPAEKGTYLAGCTFFCSIFREPAENIAFFGNIPYSDALLFQASATRIVLDSLDLWNIGLYNTTPFADFEFIQNGNIFLFYNQSTLYDSCFWDFGDGNISTLQNPTHSYLNSGTYNVQLISLNPCASDTIVKSVEYNFSRTSDFSQRQLINLYPIPCSDVLFIENTFLLKINKIAITQIDGKIVLNEKFPLNQNYELNVSNLKKGVYIVSIYMDNEIIFKKIIKT